METAGIAKVAVSAAPYSIDKPYDYLIPAPLAERAVPGVRVTVPFGKGNRTSEGIILAVGTGEKTPALKPLGDLLDAEPVLNREGIQMALWMRSRYFCTLFEAVKTILPAGLWYHLQEVWTLTGTAPEPPVPGGEAVLEALRDFGWSRLSIDGGTGTAPENDARLAREQEQTAGELQQAREALASMGDRLDDLCRAADRAALDIRREEGRIKLRDTEQTFLLQGWVPAEQWEKVQTALERYPCAYELEDPAEEEYPQVPVQLKNNWFTRPLSMVTEMYSLPAYGTLDPNPLMAPFFILFYGIMLADMGYGLLMILGSVFVLKKVRPKGGMWNFFALLGLCGVSTFVMGAITGGFFGDFLTQLTTVMGMENPIVLPALFTPLNDTMMILVGAMCLGFVQILTGMAISVVQKIRAGKFMDALWEEITWWVVFLGLGLMVLGVTNLVLYAGLVLVVAGPLITGKGLGKITGIFGSLYNHITGYFGDILSYSRLMALMLAGSVIAQVFNTLGAIPGNVVIFLVISLAGNALNFALNLLGCYVHDLRLQCLEFFKNFYVDGGRPFRPIDLTTKYYDVVK